MLAHILYDIPPDITKWDIVFQVVFITINIVIAGTIILYGCFILDTKYDFFTKAKSFLRNIRKKKAIQLRGFKVGDRAWVFYRTWSEENDGRIWTKSKTPLTIRKFIYDWEKDIEWVLMSDGNRYYRSNLSMERAKHVIDRRPGWF